MHANILNNNLFSQDNYLECVKLNNYTETVLVSTEPPISTNVVILTETVLFSTDLYPTLKLVSVTVPNIENDKATNLKMLARSTEWPLFNYLSHLSNPISQKNFISGLHNARKLLDGLEQSLAKTVQYEARLLNCRATHAHSHDDLWSSDMSLEKDFRTSKTELFKTSRSQVDLAESWSTMSIVCLQYQYEELTKRYEALLRAYHERCSTLSERDAALARFRLRTRNAHAQLAHAHKTLLTVGEKYLALWQKKHLQMKKYERRMDRLQATVRGVVAMCEHARLELDTRITRFMEKEQNAPNAQLLAEIRKCNLLYLENLRLKGQVEKMKPGLIFYNKS